MAVWTELAARTYRQVLTSTFVNSLVENVKFVKEIIDGVNAYTPVALGASWYTDTAYADMAVSKLGPTVFFRGSMLYRSAALGVGGSGGYQVGTVPVGFRPAKRVIFSGSHAVAGNFFGGHWFIEPTGAVLFVAYTSGTIATSPTAGNFAAPGNCVYQAA